MRLTLLIILISFGITCTAQGIPPLQNFTPAQYGGENQNWDIAQDAGRILYIANSQGLLEYNGAHWSLYPLPNESIVRSVRVFDEKIYTGGFREFGFWERNAIGQLEYTSLSNNIREKILPDEEFWNILKLDRLLVFHSLNRIYTFDLDEQTLNWVETDSSLPGIFTIGQTVYFQRPGEGLFSIENGIATLKFNTPVFREDEVVNMFELDGDVLVLTRQNGFYAIRGEVIEPWGLDMDRELSGMSIYSAIALRGGGFALGTISEGLILLDREGRFQYQVDQSKGLQNNTVLSLYEDQEGNLWLGLDNGLSVLNLRSAYRVYQDNSGFIGSVYAVSEKDGYLYMGTNQGLYYLEYEKDRDFRLVPGTEGQVWSLDLIGDTLFCGHHTGTYTIEAGRAKKVVGIGGTWGVKALPGRTDLLLQGNYTGLYVLEGNNGTWELRNRIDNFSNSSRFFEVYKGEIFVNHEYKGLFRMKVDDDYREVSDLEADTLHRGANSGLISYRDQLLFAFRDGVFSLDGASRGFKKDTVLSSVLEEGGYVSGKLDSDREGKELWIFTQKDINNVSPGNLNSSPVIRSVPLMAADRGNINGYENIYGPDAEGRYIAGSNNGFISFDTDRLPKRKFEVGIQKVAVSAYARGTWIDFLSEPGTEGRYSDRENNLEIYFYAPVYSALITPRFQYRLSGLYEEWSEWTEEKKVSFNNLPHGTYLFEVRAKVGNDISTNKATYSFVIDRPWYATGLAMVSYLLIALFGAIVIHRTYRRYYRNRQQEIIDVNKKEMELQRMRNEKEIANLKNRQLEEEFRNKSNELAASTMSLIKKNELLTRVKEQLLASEKQGSASVNQIVKIIDKSIDQNDDWEMFLEAFNNADHKFLKKLKNKHPNLSPNDIKLCAYLRLNLSSKEIAPLLNISTRSVEIKRYRLRKKMNLEHDSNLTEYIIAL